ncbi:MAG: phosphoenolpyruvate mutase [Magnetospirillum sp. WYHS-4]
MSTAFPAVSQPLTKAGQFRRMLESAELEFIMEAHDGISAKIVEEAGFKGIWGSGLSLSAALGVRDNNEASWTQVLEMLEFMSDATSIPILVDGDTGYGNFNNARRVVKKLCQRQVAGICIEDKLFPKTNSFIGENQPLADMEEFCGKIKAAKDSQTDPDFSVVARVEALISGWGMDEALRRAIAYREAGADAILIHSKQRTADEILAFRREFGDRAPVVIVPTKYYQTPTDTFREAGISLVIWANHNLRAAISAMRETSRRIQREESLLAVEPNVATLEDVFRLTGDEELADAEKRYLPSPREVPKAVVLAASRGAALGKLTEDRPKCMIDVRGQPLLRRLVATLKEGGLRDITVVRGYHKDMVNLPGIRAVDNDDYAGTGEAASLACAQPALNGEVVVAYGDILFRHYILDRLRAADGDIVVTVDALWRQRKVTPDEVRDYVSCSRPFSTDYLEDSPVTLARMGNDLPDGEICGEWMGLARFSAKGAELLRAELDAMKADGSLAKASLLDVFSRLAARGHAVRVLYVTGQWMDVDTATDLIQAGEFL